MRSRLFALTLSLIAVASLLIWFAGVGRPDKNLSDSNLSGPYTEALAQGQAHLLIHPHPTVLAAKDPFLEPAAKRHLLNDASYYEGRYYIYFGVVPFALLLVPWFWLTGVILTPAAAVVCFSLIGNAAYGLMLVRWVQRFRPDIRLPGLLAGLAVIVVASGTWSLLGRPAIYEIENAAAHALLALALLALFHAEIGIKRAVTLPLAAGCAALVMGCRPNYFPAISLLALWIAVRGWQSVPAGLAVAPRITRVAVYMLPLVLVGAALAGWNIHRFGTPEQFGLKYTVSQDPSATRPLTDLANVPYSLHRYFLGGAHLSPYFPFIQAPKEGPVDMGPDQEPSDQLYGFLWIYPVILGAFLSLRVRPPAPRAFLGLLVALFLGNLSFLARIPMSCYRYPADLLGPLTFVAAVGWLQTIAAPAPWRRWLTGGALTVLLTWSFAAVICQTFSIAQTHTHFDTRRADDFARVARPFNRVAYAIEALTGRALAAVALTLTLPAEPSGPNEPLVVMGRPGAEDFLFVHYVRPGVIVLGFESTGRGGLRSSPIELDASQPHRIELHCGSLLPPADHPQLQNLADAELKLARELVVVTLDGKVVIDGPAHQHRPSGRVEIGRSPHNTAFGSVFTGEIQIAQAALHPQISPDRWQHENYGPIRLEVELVPLPAGVCDPLLSLGLPGKGAQLLAEHQPGGAIKLIWRTATGEELVGTVENWPLRKPVVLEIKAGSLLPPAGSTLWSPEVTPEQREHLRQALHVTLDDSPVLAGRIAPVDNSPALLALGRDTLVLRAGVMPMSAGTVRPLGRLAWP